MISKWWEMFKGFAMANLVDSVLTIFLTVVLAALLLTLVNWVAHKAKEHVMAAEMEATAGRGCGR